MRSERLIYRIIQKNTFYDYREERRMSEHADDGDHRLNGR